MESRALHRRPIAIGIHGLGHDVNVAVIELDGSIVHVAEEERYSRLKGSSRVLSTAWVHSVLDEVGAEPGDVQVLAVAGISGLVRRRRQYGQHHAVDVWNEVDDLTSTLPELRSVEFVRHHVAHAASAAWCSGFDRCLVVTADGMGETDTLTVSAFADRQLSVVERATIPHSIGWVYRRLCNWAGLRGIEREGKFMGLAAHGRPTVVDELRAHVLWTGPDGSIRLAPEMEQAAAQREEQRYLVDLLGIAPDVSDSGDDGGAAILPVADVAASIQQLLGEVVGGIIGSRAEALGVTAVATAGGVFMNSVLNGELARHPQVSAYFAQPLSGDNGLGLGAALHAVCPIRSYPPPHLYLGSPTGSPSLEEVARRHPELRVSRHPLLAVHIAGRIADGEVVAVCRGRSEIGSRALGHRSVLASAVLPGSGPLVNRLLKRREAWRPFAVTLLEEAVELLFGAPLRTPFMTEVHPLARPALVPGIAHVDGTSRPQTVSRQNGDPFLVELLDHVGVRTGVPAVLNTSLNRNGEPLVRSWQDALNLLVGSGISLLVLDDLLVEKQG